MWLHVPSTSLASAPVTAASSLDSTQPWMEELARSVMWKTRPVAPQSLRRVWKTVPSIRRLSGLTSAPSTQSLGVAEWISSLGDSRASPTVSREASSEKMTQGNSVERSSELQPDLDTQLSFLKMSPESLDSTGTPYDPNYERWVTQLRKDSSQRQRRAHLTSENGSSSWPTTNWPTPQNKDYKRENLPAWEARQRRKAEEGINLQQNLCIATLKNWPTPTGRDYKDGTSAETVPENGLLGRAAPNWENSRSIPQAPATTKDGSGSSPDGLDSHQPTAKKATMCSPKCRRLNATFTEHLMGLPPGWTDDSEPLATESFRQWQRRVTENLHAG
jgi:hypothetical protein